MLIVKEKIDLNKIDDIVLIESLFSDDIIKKLISKNKKSITSLSIGLVYLTNKLYGTKKTKYSGLACVLLRDSKIEDKLCKKGSLLIIDKKHRKDIDLSDCLVLYEENYLPEIYMKIKNRLKYRDQVQNVLQLLQPDEKEVICPQKCLPLKLLGSGCYGNVFSSKKDERTFAIKTTVLDEKAIEKPYDCSVGSWHETHFLWEILKPLLEKSICPNLPLIYHIYSCPECCITIDNEKKKGPCVSTIIELADGTLKNYLNEKRSLEELYSCLFQVFAGLYTIQKYAQIMNFDIKKENILFYNVEPSGYWKYNILGNDYYVPNYGKLFVINDFGISRSMSPEHVMYRSDKEKTFRLGSRYAFVKDDKFIPFDSSNSYNEKGEKVKAVEVSWEDGSKSKGCEFRMERQKEKILQTDIFYQNRKLEFDTTSDEFFKNPDIIPPFEFYNDTQDALRMFTGGKRTTQRGNHRVMDINKQFLKKIKPYIFESDSSKDLKFPLEPSKVMAGYFIKSFFSFYRKDIKKSEIIEEYTI